MINRVPTNDITIPEKIDDFYYYTKMDATDHFIKYCRKKHSLDSEEEASDNLLSLLILN
jgi:protease II